MSDNGYAGLLAVANGWKTRAEAAEAERDAALEQVIYWRERAVGAARERDALAAQLERAQHQIDRLLAHLDDIRNSQFLGDDALQEALARLPITSLARMRDERAQAIQQAVKRARMEWAKEDKAALARLKAGWQASALETAVITAQMKGQTEVASWLQDLADTCRLQDEEHTP